MKKYCILCLLLFCAFAQAPGQARHRLRGSANITGHILHAETGEHLGYASIVLKGTTLMAISDASGHFHLQVPGGDFVLEASLMGFSPQAKSVNIGPGEVKEVTFELSEDVVALDQVVVSASRTEVLRRNSPTLVNVITPDLFETANASRLSEGLNFQPGVRVEDNCQNCGFNQVRINGLDGHYSQILIDSRPVFSALTGVYGLEQIPANMIDRVEVVRGGGSALYGSSAIGGTINIITREPVRNSASVAHSFTSIGKGDALDNNTTFNASLITENGKAGIIAYGQKRSRNGYDYDLDGFTELPELLSQTMGLRSYLKTGLYSKFSFQYHSIQEYRRGGDLLERPPHEANVAEQIEHNINGGGVNFDLFSESYKNHLNVFASFQHTGRKSYYGGNKDLLAYGTTRDLTLVGGAQYTHKWDRLWFMPAEFIAGAEYNYNGLEDESIGYEHYVNQIIHIFSGYAQNEWSTDHWGFLIGVRLDKHNLIDKPVFSPRVTVRFNPGRDVNFRACYSTGFRAPQAFDEDFHIAVVGGERVVTVLAKDLREERSGSFSLSADMYHTFGNVQTNLLVEAFYTELKDVFALRALGMKDDKGNDVLERYNGSGATVKGFNLEGKAVLSQAFQIQAGLTLQRSLYESPEQWSEDPAVAPVRKMFRTPDAYGYFTAGFTPFREFTFSLSGTYTGEMLVQHMAGSGTPCDVAVTTPRFYDLNVKCTYDITLCKQFKMQLHVGVQNVFNAYQNDFDEGAERDSGYIYGPSLPRSIFLGIRFDI